MPTTSPTELTVAQQIERFKISEKLVHQWVTGGPQEVVTVPETAETYPTIAKIVADNKIALQHSLSYHGAEVRDYEFTNALTLRVQHGVGSTRFTESILSSDGQRIFANVVVIDDTEFLVEFTELTSGSLTVTFRLNT